MEKNEYRIMYETEDTYWWYLAKRLFVQAILPQPNAKWKILDIGSGTGGMTKFLSQWGMVITIEKSLFALPFLKKRAIKPIHKSVVNCSFPKASFDFIAAYDVLYHEDIDNDIELIKKAYTWLKPGGYLCITDCAIPLLTSHHDKVMHARERYWLSELTNKVRSQRFIIQKSSYIFFFTFPIFMIQRIITFLIPIRSNGPIPIVINSLLLSLCVFESKLLPHFRFPFGSSVIILAQKPHQ